MPPPLRKLLPLEPELELERELELELELELERELELLEPLKSRSNRLPEEWVALRLLVVLKKDAATVAGAA
ncbi:TPA: hypothetical protein ACG4ON_004129, partial [Stenotrophomonas maltophilia]